jgi:nucleoside-diphosphate-sugar epimerase
MAISGPIAILGATSQIARDYIANAADRDLRLFGRSSGTTSYNEFGREHYSAIINFVGAGDPARARDIGADIFAVTRCYDLLALDYLKSHSETRYIFLSSGAVYGHAFAQPVDESISALVSINDLKPQDWYGVAKLYAEALHRSCAESIIDLRVFNYISNSLNLSSRFLIADMINATRRGETFKTSDRQLTRDYLHSSDFHRMIEVCLAATSQTNMALDCYSQAPITKMELVELMAGEFGMRFEIMEAADIVNATGEKPNYFSRNHGAAALGYAPAYSSRSAIREVAGSILRQEN